ncbi:manganese-dependent ADP-ribose/CDP-alcohol diphosphatase-like [Diadema setosum]|uniref:manganese-dependent ADP-ribose/CDP-alcohol diphosphatase-like n=1 Tax=Diadema setosum TaxID=31175 RepID=UPI003B3AD4BA
MGSDVAFSFGAVADVQCGDLDDRICPPLANRYYRKAVECLEDTVAFWNSRSKKPSVVVQLGDVLDGFNAMRGGKELSRQVLNSILNVCASFEGDFHHAWGNHELYNFSRHELLNGPLFSGKKHLERCHPQAYKKSLSSSSVSHNQHLLRVDLQTNYSQSIESNADCDLVLEETVPAYYDFSPHKGFRFVILDTFEMSVHGYKDSECALKDDALSILRAHNQNSDLEDHSGLEGLEKRFVDYNGGISNTQLDWLQGVLSKASVNNEKVMLFGHVPICPEVTLEDCLVWNYQEVLDILRASPCVVATLFGHTHEYAHHCDEAGIHHLVLPAIVECQPGSNAFATFDVRDGGMVMHTEGEMPRKVDFNFRPSSAN